VPPTKKHTDSWGPSDIFTLPCFHDNKSSAASSPLTAAFARLAKSLDTCNVYITTFNVCKLHIIIHTHGVSLRFNGQFFPGGPGLAGFIGAKGDGGGGDNWSYRTCKAPVRSSPPTNQYSTFYRPDVVPVAQPTLKGIIYPYATLHTDAVQHQYTVTLIFSLVGLSVCLSVSVCGYAWKPVCILHLLSPNIRNPGLGLILDLEGHRGHMARKCLSVCFPTVSLQVTDTQRMHRCVLLSTQALQWMGMDVMVYDFS